MKLKSSTIVLLLIIFTLLCSCNAKKRIARTDKVDQTTHVESKHDERTTERKESTINITDTTKKSEQKIEIVEIRRTEKDSTSEVVTDYKKTTLFISDEDKFLFENGYLKDSTEVKNADDLVEKTTTEIESTQKETIQNKEKVSKILFLSIFLCLLLLVCGYVAYKNIKKWKR